jgi:hypothetical protein
LILPGNARLPLPSPAGSLFFAFYDANATRYDSRDQLAKSSSFRCEIGRLPIVRPDRTMARNGVRYYSKAGAAMVTESDNIVAETAARIFADLADPQTINRARDTRWKEKLWHALSDAGLPLAWVPEKQGGAGGSLADGFAILGVAGRYALPVPLAETLLAGWLLARAGISSPAGPMTVAPARPRDKITLNKDGTLSGLSRGVAFAKDCEHFAVIATGDKGASVALVKTGDCRVAEGKNVAGDGSDRVTFDGVKPLNSAPAPFDVSALMLMGATMRSVQAAGAMETLLSLSVRYANPRAACRRNRRRAGRRRLCRRHHRAQRYIR